MRVEYFVNMLNQTHYICFLDNNINNICEIFQCQLNELPKKIFIKEVGLFHIRATDKGIVLTASFGRKDLIMKDKLVLEIPKKYIWKPIMVEESLFNELEKISKETGLNKGEIANKIINFGLERIEIKKE